ncbi:MAG: hypothetical protein ACI88G_001774 [Woeseiaceae bacterium]|jgi:hypothetical protein
MPGGVERHEPDSLIDRIELTIALILQIGILVVTVGALLERQWLVAFSGTVTLLLTCAPAAIERRLRVPLPVEITLITSLFLYASFALGEVRDFYEKFWWWDLALHGLSALTIGVIGFLGIYVFHMTHRIRIAPGWLATITFALALSLGTLWEIFEFLMDWYFGVNMQKSGLVDTMTDLLINAAGAAIAALLGYLYVRKEDGHLARRLIETYANRHNK